MTANNEPEKHMKDIAAIIVGLSVILGYLLCALAAAALPVVLVIAAIKYIGN